jgi:deazaflavin-dependent oxidoreductase (nitroreductase family)
MTAPEPQLSDGTRGRLIRATDRRFIRLITGSHRRLIAASGGRALGRMGGHPLLILTTTGRRTGGRYSTPVIGIRDGTDWLIVASNGGAATQPVWIHNIAADPAVTVRLGKDTETCRARVLSGDERAQWWPKLVKAYPTYAKMQEKTDRELPIVRLAPASLHRACPASQRTA